jgi:hypothetical protein
MHRIFLGLVITDGVLLAATYGFGLAAPPPPRGAGAYLHGIHWLLGMFTVLLTMMVHSIAYTYFLGTGKWIKEVARVYRLPDWVETRAKKNKRRAFPFEFWSMMFIGGTAWLGAGTDALGWSPSWHLGMASLTIAFNIGSFWAEYMMITAQAKLILEVKNLADGMRLASFAAADSTDASPSTSQGVGGDRVVDPPAIVDAAAGIS